jgi:hypothetical protein
VAGSPFTRDHTIFMGTPKMPGEPKRVQPSRDTDLKRENKRK